jgi:glutaminyl-tRNA synthetase
VISKKSFTFKESTQVANNETNENPANRDFIRAIVADDLAHNRTGGRVATRFPPEPNGYLHIGHAKSIALNFGIAEEFGGVCHLRFDDTNPETEDIKYAQAIQRDLRWLGYDWGEHLYFASDYFEQLYDWAVQLIEEGKAYVDDLNDEEIRTYRGTVTESGKPSPYRDRSVEENLDLFARMRAGEFEDGAKVLRARIDLASPNMKMRDPVMYRIRHAHHYRRGDEWCIFPLYDWAHGQSDAIERITHSICTLEFENNRELYDWYLDALGIPDPRPHQYEFARLFLDYTVMSKRKMLRLVNEGYVSGWDDPRMATVAGMRRRGYTPEAIRNFANAVGVARVNSRVEFELLEYHVRADLNHKAPRVMCVLHPLKVVITNYPEGKVEWLDAPYWPHDVPKEGSRPVPFTREIYIEQNDFMENPPRKFYRLSPGREVRLRHAYIIKCDEVIRDDAGEIVEIQCSYDPETRSGGPAAQRRVKGTIHWVSASESLPAEVRLYDRLFSNPNPDDVAEGETFLDALNPDSLEVLTDSRIEPSVASDPPASRYQFERQGYFIKDAVDSHPGELVFNRTVALRDAWKNVKAEPKVEEKTPDVQTEVVRGTASDARRRVREANPALAERYERYRQEYDLSKLDADLLSADMVSGNFFEAALATHAAPQSIANFMNNELQGRLGDDGYATLPFGPAEFGELVALMDEGVISANIAKEILDEMVEKGGRPGEIVERRGLRQIDDSEALRPIIEQVLADNPGKVAAYRSGKTGLLGFFMGQVMRATGGKANPQLVQALLKERLA